MKRSIAVLAASLLALPARAHEIEAGHTHVGGSVLYDVSPLLVLGAALVVLAAAALVASKRGSRFGARDDDPR